MFKDLSVKDMTTIIDSMEIKTYNENDVVIK